MAPSPPIGRTLSRAGWSVISSSTKELATFPAPPVDLEDEGARLVGEVASSWSGRYLHTIRRRGGREGAYHYEVLFSCPTDSVPVPSVVIAVRFALVCGPQPGAMPRLLYGFEEGDLTHEWALTREAGGKLTISKGQQVISVKDGYFEQYLDFNIREKDKVRERGINLVTAFEELRLQPPPQCSVEESDPEFDDEGSEIFDTGEAEPLEKRRVSSRPVEPEGGEEAKAMAAVMRQALKAAGLLSDRVAPPSSLADLLANIFDAADEENIGELPHYEVARLLGATLPGFGLEEWDIHLLLTSAQENADGLIETKPFVQAAPEMILALRQRRLSYVERGLPGVDVPIEAIKHCFSDEVTQTVEVLQKLFDQCSEEDPSRAVYVYYQNSSTTTNTKSKGTISQGNRASAAGEDGGQIMSYVSSGADDEEQVLKALKRRYIRDCLATVPERLSPQEAQRIMQMLTEDDGGFLHIDDLTERLEALRTQALLNALVETDVTSLRTHLVLRFRKIGLTNGKVKIWNAKQALLEADQVCLSRLQIHMLLCFTDPSVKPAHAGDVDVQNFIALMCVVIPHMCDAKIFVDTAERLQAETAEAIRRNENAELAALGAARVSNLGNEGEEKSQENDVDQETVERTLIQVFSLSDDTHRSPPTLPPETVFNLLMVANDPQVASCQLSYFELTGLAAEAILDANGQVPYIEFVKRWVPIIFELRKNQFLGAYLQQGAADTLRIPEPNVKLLESIFPLLPPGSENKPDDKAPKASEQQTNSSRRRSSDRSRAGSKEGSNRRISRDGDQSGPGSRRGSKGAADDGSPSPAVRLRGTMMSGSRTKTEDSAASKEPPPGRGYARRKAALTAKEAEEKQEKLGRSSSKGDAAPPRSSSHAQLPTPSGEHPDPTPALEQ
mmetsp:Transcript_68585/g.146779  ORF Transcript_68585/g.146779 Transcript_68585/m.146779 type:complete len:899 (-) Transcript_68585:75-2771(-)